MSFFTQNFEDLLLAMKSVWIKELGSKKCGLFINGRWDLLVASNTRFVDWPSQNVLESAINIWIVFPPL